MVSAQEWLYGFFSYACFGKRVIFQDAGAYRPAGRSLSYDRARTTGIQAARLLPSQQ